MRRIRGTRIASGGPPPSTDGSGQDRVQALFDDVRTANQSFWAPAGAGEAGLPAKGGKMGGDPTAVHTFAPFGEVQTGSYFDPMRQRRFAMFEDKLPPPNADYSDSVDDVAALNMGRLNGFMNADESRRFHRTDAVEGFPLEGNRTDGDAFAEAALVRRRHTEDAIRALGSSKTDMDLGMQDVRQKPGNRVGYVPNTRFAPYAPPTHRGEEISHVGAGAFAPIQHTMVAREDGRARNTAEVSTIRGGVEAAATTGMMMPFVESHVPSLRDATGDVVTGTAGATFARPGVTMHGEDTHPKPWGGELEWDASQGFAAAPAAAQGLLTGASDRHHAAERMVAGNFGAVGGRLQGGGTLSGATTMTMAAEHKLAMRPTEALMRPPQTDYAATHSVMPTSYEHSRPAREETRGFMGDALRGAAHTPFLVDSLPVSGEDTSERFLRPVTPAA